MDPLFPTDMTITLWLEERHEEALERAMIARGEVPPELPCLFLRKILWVVCDACGATLYISHLKNYDYTCKECKENIKITSFQRVESLIDENTWLPMFELLSPLDPLTFNDKKSYIERLEEAQERTQLQDAVQVGTGLMGGIPVALGVMAFDFMAGTMGSVVGEKITRLIEYATFKGMILILVSSSGGARMQEGTRSLMQMGKISGALYNYQCRCGLFYISIISSPTTGGVTASFAMLGDIVIGESKATIAFAGRRVIEQTLGEILPDNFQTAEYLLEHGILDAIIKRPFLKSTLIHFCHFYVDAPYRQAGTSM